jgi:hypothetical protein
MYFGSDHFAFIQYKAEKFFIPVYRPVRSGPIILTGIGTGKEKTLPVPSLVQKVLYKIVYPYFRQCVLDDDPQGIFSATS